MLRITGISATLGYDDPTHFARAFRRITGEPPSTWREAKLSRTGVEPRLSDHMETGGGASSAAIP